MDIDKFRSENIATIKSVEAGSRLGSQMDVIADIAIAKTEMLEQDYIDLVKDVIAKKRELGITE